METFWALLTMFGAAFGAATILPFQSEIVFAGLQARGTVTLPTLIAVASVANTLGSVVNYVLGRMLERLRGRRWFPASETQLERAQHWYRRYGVWSLLLSWAPLGDAITVAAGILRTPFWIFVLLVGMAKTARYAVLAGITAGIM